MKSDREPLLAGRSAVVIGGAGGIGRAIAHAFIAEGAAVTMADRAYGADGESPEVPGAWRAPIDVTDRHSVRAVLAGVESRTGAVDILVNSAGFIHEAPLDEISATLWELNLAINLTGVFNACQAVVPVMRRRGGGRIINIASQVGQMGGERFAPYAAAKAGVIGLTKSLGRELARENILVNAIAPGPVDTSFVRDLDPQTLAGKAAGLPLGRSGIPDEVAPSAVLLASDPGGNLYVGQTLGPNSGDVML
ncbi:SDR family NAD(P)-dependent oxidoreductase [Mycobacterium sp. MS1601]|uniref:SDR family NAD(P)-dependent oxidoreductase n=1 Tax=Mycobacterium sp. MS1601 TaxID=1936029 RepID=UPI001F46FBA8|nr:SDR family NAD(P)-dependent oxidoreductase [Mycobacterium sp. MS1601]